jgi:PadR family transcriptional regulator PadR
MEILTKLEELILLSVWRLGSNAYGTPIYRHIRTVTNKKLSLGGVYFPLDRLAKKGFLRIYNATATEERRGFSRRYYQLTERGIDALNDVNRVNEAMWEGFVNASADTAVDLKNK